MADSTTYNFQSYELHKPALDEVASVLNEGLTKRYEQVSVEVTECPNLTEEPFNLAGSGLNGKTALCDVGGPPYLIPMAQKDREPYAIDKIAQVIGYDKDAFLLGAACGPHHLIGQNCEMIPNVAISVGPDGQQVVKNNTHICKTLNDDKEFEMFKLPDNNQFCILGNLFASEGKAGKVVKIVAKKRLVDGCFVTHLREILKQKYGDKHVSMGGVFLIKSGKAKIHVMPDFSKTPLTSDDDVNNWLKFFECEAPLVCLSTLHSTESGLDLRMEHTHCFSNHGQGGHYHYDTTPDEIEYEAYYNVAETLHRIDRPKETHNIGRD